MACDQCGHPGRGHNGGCPTQSGSSGGGGRKKKKPVDNAKDIKKHVHDWSIDKIWTVRDEERGKLIRWKRYKCLNKGCPQGTKEEPEIL